MWEPKAPSRYRAAPLCEGGRDIAVNAAVFRRRTVNGTTAGPAVCGNGTVTVLATACGYAGPATTRCMGDRRA